MRNYDLKNFTYRSAAIPVKTASVLLFARFLSTLKYDLSYEILTDE